jgi:hypothetical protein
MVQMIPPTLSPAVMLDAATVDGLKWKQLSGMEHARSKLLWRAGDSVAGIMEVGPYEQIPGHAHAGSHHHMWILSGHCTVLGSELGPGGYAHIPAGVDHGIAGVGADGCQFFYLMDSGAS